ncbi:UNVERIFIED_ORG: hypothetical protein CLV66_10559 [Actinomadura viridilutea]
MTDTEPDARTAPAGARPTDAVAARLSAVRRRLILPETS